MPGAYIQDVFSQGKVLVGIATSQSCMGYKRSSFILEQLTTIEKIQSSSLKNLISSKENDKDSRGEPSTDNDSGMFIEEPAIIKEINGLKMRSQSQDLEALANKLELDMNNVPKALIVERNNYFDKTMDQIKTCIQSFKEIANDTGNFSWLIKK